MFKATKRFQSSLLQVYQRPPAVFTSGSGCYLRDTNNNDYLDFTAGIAVNALGHADYEVGQVIAEQAAKLIHISNLYHNEYAEKLAKLITSSPAFNNTRLQNSQVFFCNSGTEANEAAFKFARKFGRSVHDSKIDILSFVGAFHGRTFGALTATPNQKYQQPFLPLVPGIRTVKHNDDAVLESIDSSTCAVIIEPVQGIIRFNQGEGGITPVDPSFFKKLREKCDETGALLICDEIQVSKN
jgi:acetylornithine/succinyldiaminopimelate/putrescine aminotransferase